MKLPLKAVRLSGLLFAIILSALFHTERLAGQGNAVASVYERLLRVEINAKSDDETYRLIPCGEKGVILFYKSLEIVEQDKVKWYFSFYDKDLQLLWTKSIGLANALEFKKYSFDPDILSLFFRADEKAYVWFLKMVCLWVIAANFLKMLLWWILLPARVRHMSDST
jgi:hypothetical protein